MHSRNISSNARGFSLVEILFVVVIIGILLSVGFPALMKWVPNTKLRGGAQDLLSDMQRAKVEAIKRNSNVIFTFTTEPPNGAGLCEGGGYTFSTLGGDVIVNKDFTNTGLCLATVSHGNLAPPVPSPAPVSDFAAGDGITPRGLPINSPPAKGIALTDNSDHSTFVYVASQTLAGGIMLDRY